MPAELREVDDVLACPVVAAAVDRLVAAGRRAGMYFDFDGVLSRIAADPESVWPTDGVAAVLEALSGKVGQLALLSSRTAQFLHDRLGYVSGLEIYGLYGLERIGPDGAVVVEPAARQWVAAAARLRDHAVQQLPGVYVEDKKLTVGLHYRQTPHRRDEVEAWARAAAADSGFGLRPGRMAVELIPPLDVDKGSTLAGLISGLRAAWYFGDDLGDLPAFAAVHDRVAAGGGFSGLAVGIGNDTVVPEVFERSDVFLAAPELLVDFLRHVLARFED